VSTDEAETAIETTIDEDGNLLIVRAAAEVHNQIKMLLKELDRPVDTTESPIQFYKLRNANAIEVLYSLLALQEVTGSGQVAQAGGLGYGQFGTLGGLNVGGVSPAMGILGGRILPDGRVGIPGINVPMRLPLETGNADDTPPASTRMNQNTGLSPLIGNRTGLGGAGFGGVGAGVGGGQVATLPGGARVSADVATNSLIVYAPANVQPLYEKLIRSLDQRRPQVMIEAEIVAVDTSDNFSLGVEVSIGDRTGTNKLFKFTSFGLSQVDPTNGMLTPIPNLGFNGVLLDPEVADVIVQALSQHTRGRVLASPQILVNDNQTGTLESVASQPFSSVNATATVGTTSLGGDQQAGTIITVTPHINEDDHLQLEFEVEFSAFVGDAIVTADGGRLPPARQIDRVGSVVTIPDGKTIVVGGLKQVADGSTFSGVPWTEHIPVLRELTSLKTGQQRTTSFFLFIRPTILRDSRFRDLRYLSDIDAQDAEIEGDFPESRPIVIPCLKPPTQTVRHPNSAIQR
jgi:general secretion pathway protein D